MLREILSVFSKSSYLWILDYTSLKFLKIEFPTKFHQNRFEKGRISSENSNVFKLYSKMNTCFTKLCEISECGAVQRNTNMIKSCRSRKMLKNAPTLAFGAVHSAENEPDQNANIK